jgi:hypothetical protein
VQQLDRDSRPVGQRQGFWSKIPKLGVTQLSKRVVRAKQVKKPGFGFLFFVLDDA